jgi:O-antigen ligase
MCAILLTASRGALLALVTAAPFVLFTLARLRVAQKLAVGVASAAGLAGVVYLVPASSFQRLSTIGAEISGGSFNERKYIWEAGLEVWREHPMVGVGAGTFPTAVEHGLGYPPAAHNLYLSVLAENGFVGFLLFLLPVGVLCVSLTRAPLDDAFLLGTLLVAWGVGVFSLAWEWRKPTFFLIGLAAAWVAAPADRPAGLVGETCTGQAGWRK